MDDLAPFTAYLRELDVCLQVGLFGWCPQILDLKKNVHSTKSSDF